MTRILLVGGGLTSAVTGAILKKELPSSSLVLWDKARGLGGRMSTSRSNEVEGAIVDLGAQYITATPEYMKQHKTYYDELLSNSILKKLTAKVSGIRDSTIESQNFITPNGVSSIVKYFVKQADCSIKTGFHLSSITSEENGQWLVKAQNGEKEQYDIVILTMPVPQVMAIEGFIKQLIESDEKLRSNLSSVEYSSRYALGLFYNSKTDINLGNEYAAKYITDHPIIRFVAIDNQKRTSDQSGTSVVIHTSVPFGKANIQKTADEVKPLILNAVQELFPNWPTPVESKCQKWRFSQVTSSYPGIPGSICIADGLFIGGDAFTHSNMDGCIESAVSLANRIKNYVAT